MKLKDTSVISMWENYLKSLGKDAKNTKDTYTSWHFCDNEYDANKLAELVVTGTKRGTSSLLDFYSLDNEELPKVGEYCVITNWQGIARCIIKIKKIHIIPFSEVTEELATIEGEGDKSLAYWRNAHIKFFTRGLKEFNIEFNESMKVVFEEFEVVYK